MERYWVYSQCLSKSNPAKGAWNTEVVKYADAQAQLEAVRRERDHAKKMAAVQEEVADNQTWHVQQLRQAIEHIHKAWAAKTPHEFHVWFAQHVALARATLEAAPTPDPSSARREG